MKISIIGTGYVGLVTGTCLADFGLSVTCVDQDETKISLLNSGGVPIYEPNLEALIQKNVSAGRLTFTTDLEKAVKQSKVIFIAVGTSSNHDGSANLKQIEKVAQQIGLHLNEYKVIVNKSTVPIGTARKIKEIISSSSPSPLRGEGRVRVKSSSVIPDPSSVIPAKAGIHPSVAKAGIHPSVIARSEATKQSQPTSKPFDFDIVSNPEFLREGSAVYDFTHPDKIVIGTTSPKFLHPGPGYGGSCFPKDTEALYHFASTCGYDFKLLKGVISANKCQRELMVEKIKCHLDGNLKGKIIAILGLAFKQNTDDIRKSPAIDIIKLLLKEGAKIRCFDPLAMDNTQKILPSLTYCQDEYETAKASDALVIAHEWNQFRNLDLLKIKKLLKNPILLDLSNLYNPEKAKSLGFIYAGVGRK